MYCFRFSDYFKKLQNYLFLFHSLCRRGFQDLFGFRGDMTDDVAWWSGSGIFHFSKEAENRDTDVWMEWMRVRLAEKRGWSLGHADGMATPTLGVYAQVRWNKKEVISGGIEPPTFCVLDRCDNHYTTRPHERKRSAGCGRARKEKRKNWTSCGWL